jgi:hypothetical protein
MLRFLVLLTGLTLLACAGNQPSPNAPAGGGNPPDPETAGLRVELAPGESYAAQGGNVAITFGAVREDSRCPRNVRCIWAGNAAIRLDLTGQGGDADTIILNSAIEPKQTVYHGVTIGLEEVQPYPVAPGVMDPRRYRVVLRIQGN